MVDMRTTGVAIVEALAANGVDLVFGIPGTHNLEIYRGINSSPVRHIVTRHEQGAAYAADGYARATGRPGVVITTSGPGLTNALTGMANAYADSIPMLVLSPGVPTGLERQDFGWLHETKDQRGATDNLVARSVRTGTPEQTIDAIHEAFARWHTERPRPVHVEIPLDVLERQWSGAVPAAWTPPSPPAPAASAVARLTDILARARRVVLIVGGGCVDAGDEITRLAESIDAATLTTDLGKGVIDENHPLAAGPFSGSPASADLVEGADVVVALGTKLTRFVGSYPGFAGVLVRVDIDPGQLHKNRPADIAIQSDVGEFARSLTAACHSVAGCVKDRAGTQAAARNRERCVAYARQRSDSWEAIQSALAAALPDDVIVAGDSSQVSYLGTGPYWRFNRSRRYLVTNGYSTLGYAVPAAIGAKLGLPDRPVVALLGDGALMFTVQELMTAVEIGIGLPIIVVDNDGFGEIRENMVERSIEPLAVTLRQPDFVAMAQAMGCRSVAVSTVAEAADAAAAGLADDRPSLIVLKVGAP